MDQRVKRLAEQAGVSLDTAMAAGVDLERFARLIANDCAEICLDNGRTYQSAFTPARAKWAQATANHCGYLIKQIHGIG